MSYQTPCRRRYKKRYYKRHQYGNLNGYGRYTVMECKMILEHNVSDVELARLLGRSLMAIQIKRLRLNK